MISLFSPAALVGVAGPWFTPHFSLMMISEGRQPKYSLVTCSCHQSLISQTHGETPGWEAEECIKAAFHPPALLSYLCCPFGILILILRISSFAFSAVNLFKTMLSQWDGPVGQESTNPICVDQCGAAGRQWQLRWRRISGALSETLWGETWTFPISLQTTWSWCCSLQPSLSLERPASGPDPQSSISPWVYHPVHHFPRVIYILLLIFAHLNNTRVCMGSDPAFPPRCRSSFFYHYYCFRPELRLTECTHGRQLIKDTLLCWNWGQF